MTDPLATRAVTLGLFEYIHSTYAMNIARERTLRNFKAWLLFRFWLGLALTAIAAAIAGFVYPQGRWLIYGLLLVSLAGWVGSIVSITQRLQSAAGGNVLRQDPIFELVGLGLGRNGVRFSMLSASLFALLVYAFFATGVPNAFGFDGGLAPRFIDAPELNYRDNRVRDAGSGAVDNEVQDETAAETEANAGGAPGTDAGAGDAAETEADAGGAAEPASTATDRVETGEITKPEGENRPQREAAEAFAAQEALNAAVRSRSLRLQALAHAEMALRAESASAKALRLERATDLRRALTEIENRIPALRETARSKTVQARASARIGEPLSERPELAKIARSLGLVGITDLFALLLWAFIAGFAERLVPDILTNLADRQRRSDAASKA